MRIGLLILLLLTPGAALVAASSAAASGGTSIAKAPLVASGAELSGDTTSDATTPGDNGIGFDSGCWHDLEFWRLELGAGDAATFWGGGIDPGDDFELGVFPPGTTDASLAKANSVRNGFPKQRSVVYDAVVPGRTSSLRARTVTTASTGPSRSRLPSPMALPRSGPCWGSGRHGASTHDLERAAALRAEAEYREVVVEARCTFEAKPLHDRETRPVDDRELLICERLTDR